MANDKLTSKTKKTEAKRIGERIRELRKERGWTQKELAQAMEMNPKSFSSIGMWERGESMPLYDTIRKIARALDIDPYEIEKVNLPSWTRLGLDGLEDSLKEHYGLGWADSLMKYLLQNPNNSTDDTKALLVLIENMFDGLNVHEFEEGNLIEIIDGKNTYRILQQDLDPILGAVKPVIKSWIRSFSVERAIETINEEE